MGRVEPPSPWEPLGALGGAQGRVVGCGFFEWDQWGELLSHSHMAITGIQIKELWPSLDWGMPQELRVKMRL